MRESQTRESLLTIAGGYELTTPGGGRTPDDHIAPALVKAYDRIGYEVGYLAPAEDAWLRQNHVRKPVAWTLAGERPNQKIITRSGLRLGIIFFPAVNPALAVPQETFREVLDMAAALKGQVDLVIGMSIWGSFAESKLLETPGQSFDILCGSGPGSSVSHNASSDGRTIWLRPYAEGKTIIVLDILDRSPKPHNSIWIKDKNYSSRSVTLDDNYPVDPAVQAYFKK